MIKTSYITKLSILISILLISACSSSQITISNKPDTATDKIDISYHDYWSAMLMAAPEYADSNDVTSEQKEFAQSMKYICANDIEKALPILEKIYASKSDTDRTTMKYVTKSILYHYYLSENRLDICHYLDYRYNPTLNAKDSSISKQYAGIIKQKPYLQYIYQLTDTIPFSKDYDNWATIKVEINGKEFNMVYDTGAMVTIVSEEVAEICGLPPIVDNTSVFGTSNEKNIEVFNIMIDSIRISKSIFKNLIAKVSTDGGFEVGIPWIWTFFKIDGLIGWDIIKHFQSEFDFENKQLVLSQPAKKDSVEQNLFWLAHPIVKVSDSRGIPYNFFFDSGANSSSFTELIKQKLPETELGSRFLFKWGLGGSIWDFTDTYPEYSFYIGNKMLNITDFLIEEDSEIIFLYDATIGSNICQGGKIMFDPMNGVFEIIERKEEEE